MRSIQLIILLVMIHNIFNGFLFVETSSIHGLLCEAGLNNIEFAKMPSAFTDLTAAVLFIVMLKVIISQLFSSSSECLVLFLNNLMISFHVICLSSLTKLGLRVD